MSVPSNFTVSDRNSGSTGPPVHSWSGMESIWISLKTAVTVTARSGIANVVVAASARAKERSIASSADHSTKPCPSSGAFATTVTVSPARAVVFVVEPSTTVTAKRRSITTRSAALPVAGSRTHPASPSNAPPAGSVTASPSPTTSAAALKAPIGCLLIIAAYAQMTPEEAADWHPTVIFPKNNQL